MDTEFYPRKRRLTAIIHEQQDCIATQRRIMADLTEEGVIYQMGLSIRDAGNHQGRWKKTRLRL